MLKPSDEAPHSVALWFRYEIHPRKADGFLLGAPKEHHNYSGTLHFQDLAEAKSKIEEIIANLKKDIENANSISQKP